MKTVANEYFLRDPMYRDWSANARQVARLLGLADGEKLPAEGLEPRLIQGIMVRVRALGPARPNGRRRMTHRVLGTCPGCRREMSVGRLRQHRCPATAMPWLVK